MIYGKFMAEFSCHNIHLTFAMFHWGAQCPQMVGLCHASCFIVIATEKTHLRVFFETKFFI